MAKRRATEQIRKDQASDLSSSSEDEDIQKRAAPEVLAGRRIAVPRTRRNLQTSLDSEKLNSEKPNPFGSMAKSPEKSSVGGNPFEFLGGKSQPTSSKPPSSSTSKTPSNDLKFRGLNASFAAQINKANSESPFEDWSVLCEKYLSYARSIVGPSNVPIVSKQILASSNDDDSSKQRKDTPKSQITSSGFKFGGSTPSNPSSFTFGEKTVNFSKTHSSKPSGGFVFNPNGPGEIKAPQSSDTSMMNDANDESEEEPKDDSRSNQTSSPTIGENKGSIFSSLNTSTKESNPASSLKAVPVSNTENKADSPKPLFNFGKASSAETLFKPGVFQFGSGTANTAIKDSASPQNKFTFGSQQLNVTESKPSFTFGKPSANTSIAKSEAATGSSSTLEKSSSDAEKPKPFTFGNSSAISSSTSFSFGGGGGSGSSSVAEKPKFSFGPTAQLNKSGFSFGTGSNPFASSQSESTSSTSNSAKLTPSGIETHSGDAGRLDATWNPSHPIRIDTASEAGNTAVSSGTEATGDPSDEQNDPQTNLGGPGPGEEDENSVYEKKSKVFEQVDGEFKPLGLGVLRVLVHKVSQKVRILVRAEGSGRILLNIPIRKEFSYKVIGKGQVRAMDIKPGNSVPSTYILRVKTDEDGNELAAKLEEVKS